MRLAAKKYEKTNKQEFYREEYAKLNPRWKRSLDIYRDLINNLVTQDAYLLDIGCGHGELLKNIYRKTKNSYGLDPDAKALEKNDLIKHKIVGFVEKMPFPNNMFDVIVLEWVLEHLPDPESAFQEIYRILKPGGKIVFITPNAWNYNTWIIRAIPNAFHPFFTKKLYGRHEGDTYPVKYRINTAGKQEKILSNIGFKKINLIFNGDPSYISFNKPTFWLALVLERIIDWKPLNFLRVHLIGVFEKK